MVQFITSSSDMVAASLPHAGATIHRPSTPARTGSEADMLAETPATSARRNPGREEVISSCRRSRPHHLGAGTAEAEILCAAETGHSGHLGRAEPRTKRPITSRLGKSCSASTCGISNSSVSDVILCGRSGSPSRQQAAQSQPESEGGASVHSFLWDGAFLTTFCPEIVGVFFFFRSRRVWSDE